MKSVLDLNIEILVLCVITCRKNYGRKLAGEDYLSLAGFAMNTRNRQNSHQPTIKMDYVQDNKF